MTDHAVVAVLNDTVKCTARGNKRCWQQCFRACREMRSSLNGGDTCTPVSKVEEGKVEGMRFGSGLGILGGG
mgnify:CR=1 FL=1